MPPTRWTGRSTGLCPLLTREANEMATEWHKAGPTRAILVPRNRAASLFSVAGTGGRDAVRVWSPPSPASSSSLAKASAVSRTRGIEGVVSSGWSVGSGGSMGPTHPPPGLRRCHNMPVHGTRTSRRSSKQRLQSRTPRDHGLLLPSKGKKFGEKRGIRLPNVELAFASCSSSTQPPDSDGDGATSPSGLPTILRTSRVRSSERNSPSSSAE